MGGERERERERKRGRRERERERERERDISSVQPDDQSAKNFYSTDKVGKHSVLIVIIV